MAFKDLGNLRRVKGNFVINYTIYVSALSSKFSLNLSLLIGVVGQPHNFVVLLFKGGRGTRYNIITTLE